jgi:glycosyltransferase involved in cell wall biosynthesis
VLTTCNLSFSSDWSENYHPSGTTEEGGLTIRRFPVEPHDKRAFDSVNAKLLALGPSSLRPGVSPLTKEEAHTFIHQNIKSIELLDYLRAEQQMYDAFIFLPYMFAPTVLGLPLVAERAWLQPCLHDEPQAYFAEIAELFRRARRLLFNSEGEFELALRLFGPGIFSRSTIVGEGIERATDDAEPPRSALPASLRNGRFVLYLGRRDATKNVDLLARAFAQFKSLHPESDLQLVLAGPGPESFAGEGLHDLGAVSEETKVALLDRARALAQPSRKESFSRAIMEAWSRGRPVIAHRECLATASAVERSGGGWLATYEGEWSQLFARIESFSDQELAAAGARGQAYASDQADWEAVIDRYEDLLSSELRSDPTPARPVSRLHAIHQLLPDIAYGDAISNHARTIRDRLRGLGYESQIFAKRRDARVEFECLMFDEAQPAPTDGLLYHHSIGSELTAFAVAHRGPKCLVYHNITPHTFFTQYRPGFAWMLETGRAHLSRLAPYFPISVGVSAYNAKELSACGFREPRVLPLIVDPDRWDIAAEEELMIRLQDGRTNVLFVGRVAPNKQQEQLVKQFAHYRKLDPGARLIIVGDGRASDYYFRHLQALTKDLDLSPHVEITGQVTDAALLAYYRTAHLYWSASAHEGFGAPLIEAMWFDVPVLALNAAAVPETLGAAGMLFKQDEAPGTVAARAYQLIRDTELRTTVIAAQRKRRIDFTSTAVLSTLDRLAMRLTTSLQSSPVAN